MGCTWFGGARTSRRRRNNGGCSNRLSKPLISRNMIQVKMSLLDQVKTCHMHDLLHHLSRRKAKEEINLDRVIIGEGGDSHSHHSLHKTRHRTIYYSGSEFVSSTNQNKYLRSLVIQGEFYDILDIPSSYWKSFELLRFLNLEYVRLKILPKALGGLTGLRFIRMTCDDWLVSKLPRTCAKLVNLQVFVLRCGHLEIDKVVLKMDSLRHLYADITDCDVPLGKMRNLQNLKWLHLKNSSVQKIEGMCSVSELGLRITEVLSDKSISMLFKILDELRNLVFLKLHLDEEEVNMGFIGSLQHITKLKLFTRYCMCLPRRFPPNLSHLTLVGMSRAWDDDPKPLLERMLELQRWKWVPISILERLPHLVYLKLQFSYESWFMLISHEDSLGSKYYVSRVLVSEK